MVIEILLLRIVWSVYFILKTVKNANRRIAFYFLITGKTEKKWDLYFGLHQYGVWKLKRNSERNVFIGWQRMMKCYVVFILSNCLLKKNHFILFIWCEQFICEVCSIYKLGGVYFFCWCQWWVDERATSEYTLPYLLV